jgi:hypothetical protein
MEMSTKSMIVGTLMPLAVLLGSSAQSFAFSATFECVVQKLVPKEKHDKDPIYKISIDLDSTKDMSNALDFLTIKHHSTHGEVYDRFEQYSDRKIYGDQSEFMWVGNSHLRQMHGWFTKKGDHRTAMYTEELVKNGQRRTRMESLCHFIDGGL